ncbi:MAG: porin [Saprospiraceae bacterium]|nr:porin [Saprospiraceae bacterium]
MAYKKYLAEFIGTFFMLLTICMTTFAKVSSDLQPLSIGLVLVGLIYALGHISGAQFNPAITISLLLRGKMTLKDSIFYILTQFVASVTASYTTIWLISAKPPVPPYSAPPQYFAMSQAISAEVLGTFALAYIVLNIATAKNLEGNNFYGVGIGFALTGLIYTFGSISGAVFNPATAVALCFSGISSWSNLWYYFVGCFGGAILAALVFRFFGEE